MLREIPEPFLSRLRKETAIVLAGLEAQQRIEEVLQILQSTGATNVDFVRGVMEVADVKDQVQTTPPAG